MIYILGDIHGYWNLFNIFLNKPQIKENTKIICCGDFGYFPDQFNFDECIKNKKGCEIYFCDGNHEHFDHLFKHDVSKRETITINEKNKIYYQPRGSIKEIDGINFLFIGGGRSIDKQHRTPGYDWFPEEEIREQDVKHLFENEYNVDCVISHCCPSPIARSLNGIFRTDGSTKILYDVACKINPEYWYSGHYHMYRNFIYSDYDEDGNEIFSVDYTCLSYIHSRDRYYTKIKDKK